MKTTFINLFCSVALLVISAGCMSFEYMNQGLHPLVGKNVKTAFEVLGYPDGKQQFGDETVYVWSTNKSSAVLMPQTASTTGMVGLTPVYGTTTYNQAVPINYDCTIKVITGQDNIVKSCEWSGNTFGCDLYRERLTKFYRSQQNKTDLSDK